MSKLDLKKEYKAYYAAKNVPTLDEFGEIDYLILSGVGSPDGELFQKSIEALYSVSYTIKKFCRDERQDFIVPKLECFWWVESNKEFMDTPRDEWYWKLMIRMPEFVNTSHMKEAIQTVIEKKNVTLAGEVRLEEINEGKCVQAMHVGSYEKEAETIAKIFQFMQQEGLEINGYHHEIYISDPRKTPEEKLKTILRYSVK